MCSNRWLKTGIAGLFFLICTTGFTFAQTLSRYKDTIWIPVTFYDFHSDKSNPEFECDHESGRMLNMVTEILPLNKRPAPGTKPYLNNYVKYWFVNWNKPGEGGTGDFTIPDYLRGNGSDYYRGVKYDGPKVVNYDTAFKNVEVFDSLPFIHIGGGDYRYVNHDFFPLDNRGFGKEGKSHNFSYTMKVHYKFIYSKGLSFRFSGDDDLWVYVNNKLMMDIGGMHKEIADEFSLDGANLVIGKEYDLDIFYAERHTEHSHITITTNLIISQSTIGLYSNPGTPNTEANPQLESFLSVTPGIPIKIYGHIFDSSNAWTPEFDDSISWSVTGIGTIDTTRGPSVGFLTTKSDAEAVLTATYTNSKNGKVSTIKIILTTYDIKVSPYTVKLYNKSGSPGNLTPLSGSLATAVDSETTIYGHVFDTNGTWLSELDKYIQWKIPTNNQVILKPVSGAQTSFTLIKVSNDTLVATFQDPFNSKRPQSQVRLPIKAAAGPAHHIDIVTDTLKIVTSTDNSSNEIYLTSDQKTLELFAVVRDKFGNFVRYADNASWKSDDATLISISTTTGRKTVIGKESATEGVHISASEINLLPDSVLIGDLSVARVEVYPNPFVPGKTNMHEYINQKAPALLPLFDNVFQSVNNNQFVTIITFESPKPLEPASNSSGQIQSFTASIVIYDAVGNIVRKNNLKLVALNNETRKYGVAWDGITEKGRIAGTGVYLLTLKAKQTDGKSYNQKVKIGIRRERGV